MPLKAALKFGGRGEIRTHGGREPTTVFKTVALNRSATLPITIYNIFCRNDFHHHSLARL